MYHEIRESPVKMALMENFDGGSQHTGLLSSNPFDSYGHDDNLEIVSNLN